MNSGCVPWRFASVAHPAIRMRALAEGVAALGERDSQKGMTVHDGNA
jgi:hypothetical protein